MALTRRSGLLLHPSSLPGKHGIGSLGQEAYNWIEFLVSAGQKLWQIMPLGPTGYGDSPYQCFSAFAGNPYLINLEKLVETQLLTKQDLADSPDFPDKHVDFGPVITNKLAKLSQAHRNFKTKSSSAQRASFDAFCTEQAFWLDDYALFMALKEANDGAAWTSWEKSIRLRKANAVKEARARLGDLIERQKFWQWLFFEQWLALKAFANEKGVEIIGDIPIFISMDSADAWSNPELYFFDDEGMPSVVAGVPPDYFSETGQRWGNPLYRWDKMKETGYEWWLKRIELALTQVDIIRIDHFRAFESYWEIAATEETAINGKWVKGPAQDLFDAINEALPDAPIIAEDLGIITPEVEVLRDDNDLPGMKVLQFAFAADATDPYLPHNHIKNSVIYSGTHDNDTTNGWYEQASEKEKDLVRRYLAKDDDNIAWDFIRLAFASVADTAIVPLQDVMGLGSEARMNTPGKPSGNWSWRFSWEQLPYWLAPQLKDMTDIYGR